MVKPKSNVYTTSAVSKLCGVDSTTVVNWIKSGQLKSFQTPGGHYRILKNDLLSFIKEQRLPFLSQKPRPDSTKKKILLVDDDVQYLELIRAALSRESDWVIQTATSSLDAGVQVGSWRPDLLLLDLKMPGLGGLDFCRFLQKTLHAPKPPVMILSGFPASEAEKKELFQLGISDFLQKPITSQILIQKIRKFFGDS